MYNIVQYSAVQYSREQYSAVRCGAVQCNAMHSFTLQYRATQCVIYMYSIQCNIIRTEQYITSACCPTSLPINFSHQFFLTTTLFFLFIIIDLVLDSALIYVAPSLLKKFLLLSFLFVIIFYYLILFFVPLFFITIFITVSIFVKRYHTDLSAV